MKPLNENAEFEIHQGDQVVASVSGPRDQAWREIMAYAGQYLQDGEIQIVEVRRFVVNVPIEFGVIPISRD